MVADRRPPSTIIDTPSIGDLVHYRKLMLAQVGLALLVLAVLLMALLEPFLIAVLE